MGNARRVARHLQRPRLRLAADRGALPACGSGRAGPCRPPGPPAVRPTRVPPPHGGRAAAHRRRRAAGRQPDRRCRGLGDPRHLPGRAPRGARGAAGGGRDPQREGRCSAGPPAAHVERRYGSGAPGTRPRAGTWPAWPARTAGSGATRRPSTASTTRSRRRPRCGTRSGGRRSVPRGTARRARTSATRGGHLGTARTSAACDPAAAGAGPSPGIATARWVRRPSQPPGRPPPDGPMSALAAERARVLRRLGRWAEAARRGRRPPPGAAASGAVAGSRSPSCASTARRSGGSARRNPRGVAVAGTGAMLGRPHLAWRPILARRGRRLSDRIARAIPPAAVSRGGVRPRSGSGRRYARRRARRADPDPEREPRIRIRHADADRHRPGHEVLRLGQHARR